MTRRLRAVAFEAFLWTSAVAYSCVLLFMAPVCRESRLRAIARHWQRVVVGALRLLCGIDQRVCGQEHLLTDRGQIIVSNHQSAWETIALGMILPLPQTWVMKRELLRVPFFGWAVALFRPIAIARSSGQKALRQVLEVGSDRLRHGHTVIIFPEGTRVPVNKSKRFGLGAARLAALTRSPVVPIAHNAGYFWRKRIFDKFPGTIDVVIGRPIEPGGLSAGAVNKLAERWINETRLTLSTPSQSLPRGKVIEET